MWEEAVLKFTHIPISKYVESEKIPNVNIESTKGPGKTIKLKEYKEIPLTEERMIEMSNLPQKLKDNSNISDEKEELDLEFLELMGISVPHGNNNE
jgi:hypothetical protein